MSRSSIRASVVQQPPAAGHPFPLGRLDGAREDVFAVAVDYFERRFVRLTVALADAERLRPVDQRRRPRHV